MLTIQYFSLFVSSTSNVPSVAEDTEEINLFYIVIVRKSESILKVLNIAKQLYTDLIGNLKWS